MQSFPSLCSAFMSAIAVSLCDMKSEVAERKTLYCCGAFRNRKNEVVRQQNSRQGKIRLCLLGIRLLMYPRPLPSLLQIKKHTQTRSLKN